MRRGRRFTLVAAVVAAVPLTFAFAVAGQRSASTPVTGAETVPVPRASRATEELGRLLFWDPVLSGERDTACGTCHHPDYAYADGRDLSLGAGAVGLGPARRSVSGGRIPVVKRNSPTVLNTAFNGQDESRRRRRDGAGARLLDPSRAPMLWDSRVRSLEDQALEPLKAREEMRGDAYPEAEAVDAVVARLRAIPEYVALFAGAFGPERGVDARTLGEAIAAFERSLLAMNSPVDRFRAGDAAALSPQQVRGMETFDRVGCDRCHEGMMFSDYDLHAEGVREHPQLAEPDAGTRRFRFRTPSLRNVALTAPYMHNGVLRTLEDVLRFYDNGRSENPNVSDVRGDRDDRRGDGDDAVTRLAGQFRRVDDMSDDEMRDIVAFLGALTDPDFDKTIPARVPSGLPPGGSIAHVQLTRR
jgi:cytochrome c peroxidase